LVHVFLYGLLPVCVIARVALRRQSRWRTLVALLVTPLLGGGLLYANAQSWLWIDAHGRKLGGMVLPWSYAVNATRFQIEKKMQTRELALLPDATFATKADKKTVVVLIIGESARSANFSLYGYERETNPELRSRGAVALANARSCATYTTASVQCMLANVDTSNTLIHGYESLPSYLQRHGVDTVWRTRNWGEPPIKVNTYDRKKDLVKQCAGPNCNYDEALLAGLAERIAQSPSERIFIVLHQHGSHGPDYSNRYPPDGERFRPVCASVQLQDCTYETIVNAYDNTVLYTDHLLAGVIDTLRAVPDAVTAMLYVSDHGESLGEYGLYLHGTPYALAPDVQKEIPYIVWTSDAFRRRKTLAADKVLAHAKHAQMTVFHSVMGAFDMRSAVYNPQLDIFATTEAMNEKN
jgi:lipid A ethanolaminephosphotransferase